MTIFEMILLFVGVVLLTLALFSGIKLYQKASIGNADENNASMGSLWLLFLIGIVGGLLFIWFSMNAIQGLGWGILALIAIALIFLIMTLLA